MKYRKYDAMQNLNGSNHVYFCSTGNDLTRFFNSVIEELFMFHKDIVFRHVFLSATVRKTGIVQTS